LFLLLIKIVFQGVLIHMSSRSVNEEQGVVSIKLG
jgi:hypothetical protein